MKKKTLIIASIALVAYGCMLNEHSFFRSYITFYTSTDSISLSEGLSGDPNEIRIRRRYKNTYAWNSTDKNKEIYDSLCRKNNDMSFNRKISYTATPLWGEFYMAEYINSIDVFSDADFDENHPAGTPLNDIVVFKANTLKEFIDSEYKGFNANDIHDSNYYTRISKLIPQLQPEDMMLIHQDPSIVFQKSPTLAKTHNIVVVMALDNGKTETASIKKTW